MVPDLSLAPVLALLLAQVATTAWRGLALVVLVGVVSVVTLHRLDGWFTGVPRPTTQERGLGPRDTVQLVLSLVEPQSSGIGGGAFMLLYDVPRNGGKREKEQQWAPTR